MVSRVSCGTQGPRLHATGVQKNAKHSIVTNSRVWDCLAVPAMCLLLCCSDGASDLICIRQEKGLA
jgi:hypothetical protein